VRSFCTPSRLSSHTEEHVGAGGMESLELCHCWWEGKVGLTLWRVFSFPQKSSTGYNGLGDSTPRCAPGEVKTYAQTKSCALIFLEQHSSQNNVEANLMSINYKWMTNVIYPHNKVFLDWKEGSTDECCREECLKHCEVKATRQKTPHVTPHLCKVQNKKSTGTKRHVSVCQRKRTWRGTISWVQGSFLKDENIRSYTMMVFILHCKCTKSYIILYFKVVNGMFNVI
jgi:hypothetical protein